MKIAFFVRSMVNGGAEKVAAQLTCIWARLGHETVLLTELQTSGGGEYDCQYVAREFVGSEATIVSQRLRELHEKYRFDVVVFNGAINHEWFCDTFCAARALGLRTIIIIHHTANNWMYGCCNTKELFLDDVLSKADAMVCVDRMWALWWKYRGVKSVFIQNPVSVGGMRDERGGMRDGKREMRASLALVKNVDEAVEKLKGKRSIIWVGRLNDPLKRPELAIEVFARLVKDGMRDEDRGMRDGVSGMREEIGGMRFTMLGACSKATGKRLRKLFSSLISHSPSHTHSSRSPHPPSLTFPGFVTNVGEYLAKADAHLFTSATEVTVPQVVLETLTAGVDTVAFDQPVLREMGWEMRDEIGGMRDEIKEKWRKVLAGDEVECDFDTSEVRQCLMDELHRSQQWFATHHLPELITWRRWKTRMSIRYLLGRLVKKLLVVSG